ncbi:hypothetical protein [Sphingomonas sp.]|uniref:hypothetical protein n=1 Tax=Sphingomonas sp. TaxID=28214 RepID=UPI0025DD2D3B|nr:hypothetical protein [Sphingomonas sp.]MBV9528938.1 hypothetical protein [Sphingomonas sp.]
MSGIRSSIDRYCHGDARCAAQQDAGVLRYVHLIYDYSPPIPIMNSCMAEATHIRLTNWVGVAECVQRWSVGRPTINHGLTPSGKRADE